MSDWQNSPNYEPGLDYLAFMIPIEIENDVAQYFADLTGDQSLLTDLWAGDLTLTQGGTTATHKGSIALPMSQTLWDAQFGTNGYEEFFNYQVLYSIQESSDPATTWAHYGYYVVS